MNEPKLPTELHQTCFAYEGIFVIKVPGGYIYTIYHVNSGQMNSVFVPEPPINPSRNNPYADVASELLEVAWAVIANSGLNGDPKSPGYEEAAFKWRDEYFRYLDKMKQP